jgi:O-acetyl-ADP-ribose deacetylase (regulator of RNase III)
MARQISIIVGDLFDSQAQTLVNTVNCKGVMGAGLAKEFRRRWPKMYRAYRAACERGDVRIGVPLLWKGSRPWVLNFPTKDHWRGKSRLDYIERGLASVVAHYSEWEIESIAFPQLGTSHGGLKWNDVWPVMEEHLAFLAIPVDVYLLSEQATERLGQRRPRSVQPHLLPSDADEGSLPR